MTHPIDQANYEFMTQSCPNCRSMNTYFGDTSGCTDRGYEETKDGKVLNPGKPQGAKHGNTNVEPG